MATNLSDLIPNDDNIVIVSDKNKDGISTNEIISRLQMEASLKNLGDDDAILGASTSLFNVILYSVGKNLIRPSMLYYYTQNGHNTVNVDALNKLCDVYIYICYIYNKGISLIGFRMFLGLGITSYIGSSIYGIEESLSQLIGKLNKSDNELQLMNARDSKQAILNIAYNNYKHAWNGDIRANEVKATAKTLEDIRRERVELTKN